MRKDGENLRSWKGQSERVVEPVRHRWQTENARASGGQLDAPLRRVRRTLLSFVLLSVTLLSAFVYLLLHAPVKTPIITVGVTSYVWPLPPNGWAKEDVEGLASLHGKAMHWKDSSKAWQSKSTCLEDLRTQLRQASSIAKRAGTLVLYLNMHGAVNEEGDACLIPPAASCVATTQWITMDELGETIAANTPSGVKVLLVLDCVHQQVNWSIAQLNNTFVDRLESWAATSRPEAMVVLSSCSSDQRSWSGLELHSSIFGRELRLGLAGAADRPSTQSRPATGNGDGAVSMRELTDYLAVSVDGWARLQRNTSQTPITIPKSFEDFRVTWSLKGGELSRQFAATQHTEIAVSTPSSDDLSKLWQSMEELRDLAVYRYDPKNWADLERKLLWLEELSTAGSGYTELASKQVFPSLSKRLKESVERAKVVSSSSNEVAKANILQELTETVDLPSHLPSLALQEYIGEIPPDVASTLRGRLLSAAIDQDQPVLKVTASVGLIPQASQWNELNFLGISKKYDCLTRWSEHSVVQELFALRDRCEKLAIHGDIRGHRWRRPALSVNDVERRNAEDQLVLGSLDSILVTDNQESWSGLRMALSQIERSDSTALLVDSALRLRDQGFAEVAYLANWICSTETVFDNLGHWSKSDSEGNPSQDSSQFINNSQEVTSLFFREELAIQELNRLMGGLHELSELLGKVSELGDGKRQSLMDVAEQVRRDLTSLKGLVKDHVERASRSSAETGTVVREVEVLLALPFLAVDDRASLRKLLAQKMRDSFRPNGAEQPWESESVFALPKRMIVGKTISESAINLSEQSGSKRTRYADRMRNWGLHPLGALLALKDGLSLESMSAQADAKSNDRDRELGAIDLGNSRLRRCFQSMQLFGSSRVEDWCESSGVKQSPDSDSDGWINAAYSEQMERAIAPVCPIPFEANSALNFRRLAFKDLLHWYANRIADDFYADGNGDTTIGKGAESYFERSVKQVLDYASRIQGSTGTMAATVRAVKEKTQVLGPIARYGIKTSVKLHTPGPTSDRIRFEVAVMPAVSSSASDGSWKLPIPDGLASLLVRNTNGILQASRVGVSLPMKADQPSYNLVSQPLVPSLAHEAVLVYRGHEYRAPISVGEGIVVDFKPNHFDSADLVLFGDTKRQASIVFVLDCSWSMGEEIPIEAIAMKSQSRLDVAKESVLRMITQIAARPDARVGVRLFGHRLGWSRPADAKTGAPSGKTQILVQPNYPETIPNDLVPSRDVEAILPLGRFTTDMVGGLASKLSKIVPWGQSPLYLSIIESFRDFDADDNSTAKSIVVITDGDNFQFNASGRPGGEPGEITSLDGVYRAWNNTKVPLFVLGVGVSDTQNSQARKNLLDLAKHTNGKYYDIENGTDLLRALSEQLSLGTFGVSKVNQKSSKSSTSAVEAKLNTPVELMQVANESYDVSFQSISKTVQFQGGESLELHLTEDGQDIVSKPYDKSAPRAATLVRAGESGRMIVRVHRPSQLQNGIHFPISFQDPDSHFTPRPTQLWIEVTPVVTNTESPRQTYYFYDANYEPRTPVPLVNWLASNWPASATSADVRVWVKYEPTPNLQSIPFEQVKQNLQRYSEGIAVSGVEDVKLGIHIIANRANSGGLEVQITESHGDRSKGVGSIRVGLETDQAIVPSRVTRRFEPANNMAVHTFEFEASNAELFQGSPRSRLTIQSRTAAHEGAWQLHAGQPIRVEVSAVPESLPHINLPIFSPALQDPP
ncbi:MAG: vWA domain-containing protein [Pirellula sp.]